VNLNHILPGFNRCDRTLQEALKFLREGDTLVTWRLDRLSRSLKDLISFINILKEKRIHFQSLTENIETESMTGRFVFHIFGALAEFERDLIQTRTKAGLASARARKTQILHSMIYRICLR